MFFKTRGITAITVLSLVVSSVTATVAHASTFDLATGDGTVECSGGGSFVIQGYVLTEADSDCSGSAEIPEGVTEIALYGFDEIENLTSITIPATVSDIGHQAFRDLYALTGFTVAPSNAYFKAEAGVLFSKNGGTLIQFPMAKVTPYVIPASVTSIGPAAFRGVGLSAIRIPSGVVSIGASAFAQTSLTTIDIPEGVVNIGEAAFASNSLSRIHIPTTVMTIGTAAFSENLISEFSVEALNASFKTVDGVLFTKNGQTLLNYPVTKPGPYVIPAGVTLIGNAAFAFASGLTNVTIPATVTTIGENAFTSCGELTSVIFAAGSQLTAIGVYAFNNAGPITDLVIPAGVTFIGDSAFQSLTSLNSLAFAPNSQLASIGNGVFKGATSLVSISIPGNVTSIGGEAFYGAQSLTSLSFAHNSKLETIGESAFAFAKSLSSIEIPASVKSIGTRAFLQDWGVQNSLTTVTFAPNSQLMSIGSEAFSYLNALTEIVIPASVRTIGYRAFANFSYNFDEPMSLTSVAFESGSQLTTIGSSAFENQRSLNAIIIPASVTSIGGNAFQYNRRLRSLTFERDSQLKSIGDYAFDNTRFLKSVIIPASVRSIGDQAFGFMGKEDFVSDWTLSSFTFEPDSQLTSIGSNVFNSAALLPAITIPAGVSSIGSGAFSNLTTSATVYFLGNAPTTISSNSFRSGAFAYRSNCATGFPEGGTWNGLTLGVSDSSDPCLVLYNLNGGYGLSPESLDSSGRVAQAPTRPSKTGYTFANWSASNGGATIEFPYIPETQGSNITLYASWTPNTYTVIFDSRGGTAVPNGSFVTGGAIAAAPTNPTRLGWIFLGWESWAGNYEGGVEFPHEPGVLDDVTLYGYWREDPSAVSTEVQPSIPDVSHVSPEVQPPSPPQSIPQTIIPQSPPVKLRGPAANLTVVFSSGSKNLATRFQEDLKIMVEKSGLRVRYTVSASASLVRGVSKSSASNLAKARANRIRSVLMKLGVRSAFITIKMTVNNIGQPPTTKITVR